MAKTYKSLRVTLSRHKGTDIYKLYGIHTRRIDALLKWYTFHMKQAPGIQAPELISKMSAHCKSPNELAYISFYAGQWHDSLVLTDKK